MLFGILLWQVLSRRESTILRQSLLLEAQSLFRRAFLLISIKECLKVSRFQLSSSVICASLLFQSRAMD